MYGWEECHTEACQASLLLTLHPRSPSLWPWTLSPLHINRHFSRQVITREYAIKIYFQPITWKTPALIKVLVTRPAPCAENQLYHSPHTFLPITTIDTKTKEWSISFCPKDVIQCLCLDASSKGHLSSKILAFHFCPKSYNFHLPSISFPLHPSISTLLPPSIPRHLLLKRKDIVTSKSYIFDFFSFHCILKSQVCNSSWAF